MKEEFLKYFPQHIQAILNEEDLNSNEEIRIRNNLPLILRFGQAQKILNYIIIIKYCDSFKKVFTIDIHLDHLVEFS